MLKNILLAKTNDPPAELFQIRVLLFVFELLDFGRMRLAVVTLNGNVPIRANNSEVKAIAFTSDGNGVLGYSFYTELIEFPFEYLLRRRHAIQL